MTYQYIGKTPIRLHRIGLIKSDEVFESDYKLHEPLFIVVEAEPKEDKKSKKVKKDK